MDNTDILPDLIDDPLGFIAHPDPEMRRLAIAGLSGCDRMGPEFTAVAAALASDPSSEVRGAAAECLASAGAPAADHLLAATHDDDPDVAEAAVTGLGMLGGPAAVDRLLEMAQGGEDKLVREAAVAAVGAIGDERALPVLLDLVASGPPQVRRRAVAALTVFDGHDVEAALLTARDDRNPMVREAAEMVVGRAVPDITCGPLLRLESAVASRQTPVEGPTG